MSDYQCPRCAADPQPDGFGSPRDCAFDATGAFDTSNWNCATLAELMAGATEDGENIWGDDESMQIIPTRLDVMSEDEDSDVRAGWIVLTRYKSRGRTTSAVHVGDFWPAQPVTLALVNATIARQQERATA